MRPGSSSEEFTVAGSNEAGGDGVDEEGRLEERERRGRDRLR